MGENSDGGTGQQQEETELRTISEEELKNILDVHRDWVRPEKKKGESADLSHVNLEGTNLEGARLPRADLQGPTSLTPTSKVLTSKGPPTKRLA